ncbi:hypothetical protein DFJ74DRAFT_775677 [Hyaloraphidium curvatum]|nr:hypothetical protein DFJ74DRAFT_775677 [Hyaloraphidium curvatum]
MNALAGRLPKGGELGGTVLWNGRRRDEREWKGAAAYVMQADLLFEELTVEETISFAALLRLPKSTGLDPKARTDLIISSLRLDRRKRVSIGVEIVTSPSIVFLDEPTSGLDANTSFELVSTLRRMCDVSNRIVVAVLHQPPETILDLFVKVLLVANGRTVFFGPAREATAPFERLDMVTPDSGTPDGLAASTARIDLLISSSHPPPDPHLADPNLPPPAPELAKARRQLPWPREFFLLWQRAARNTYRTKGVTLAVMGQAGILVVLIGLTFLRVGASETQQALQATFLSMTPLVNRFPSQRRIIVRERQSGTYRTSSVFLAQGLAYLPLITGSVLAFASAVYWMVGLRADAGKFFLFLLVVGLESVVGSGLGLAAPNFSSPADPDLVADVVQNLACDFEALESLYRPAGGADPESAAPDAGAEAARSGFRRSDTCPCPECLGGLPVVLRFVLFHFGLSGGIMAAIVTLCSWDVWAAGSASPLRTQGWAAACFAVYLAAVCAGLVAAPSRGSGVLRWVNTRLVAAVQLRAARTACADFVGACADLVREEIHPDGGDGPAGSAPPGAYPLPALYARVASDVQVFVHDNVGPAYIHVPLAGSAACVLGALLCSLPAGGSCFPAWGLAFPLFNLNLAGLVLATLALVNASADAVARTYRASADALASLLADLNSPPPAGPSPRAPALAAFLASHRDAMDRISTGLPRATFLGFGVTAASLANLGVAVARVCATLFRAFGLRLQLGTYCAAPAA